MTRAKYLKPFFFFSVSVSVSVFVVFCVGDAKFCNAVLWSQNKAQEPKDPKTLALEMPN